MCEALRIAIDLMNIPSRARMVRSEPLPAGVQTLLRIAVGDETGEIAPVVAATARSRDVIERAAGFFIEQILLAPDADSYRVLGVTPDADNAELRRNMALLMRWLHPDLDPEGERSTYAHRVTLAWNDLKTPERRLAYDERSRSSSVRSRRKSKSKRLLRGKRMTSHVRQHTHSRCQELKRTGLLQRLLGWMGALAQLH
jgi:DnaJ domain